MSRVLISHRPLLGVVPVQPRTSRVRGLVRTVVVRICGANDLALRSACGAIPRSRMHPVHASNHGYGRLENDGRLSNCRNERSRRLASPTYLSQLNVVDPQSPRLTAAQATGRGLVHRLGLYRWFKLDHSLVKRSGVRASASSNCCVRAITRRRRLRGSGILQYLRSRQVHASCCAVFPAGSGVRYAVGRAFCCRTGAAG